MRLVQILPLLFALAASSYSMAVAVNPKGTGQVLLYPYYTVADKQDTLISITNIQQDTKLVRFNVRESLNSQLVYSFDLILRPNDNWSAAITLRDDGATLVSADTACTMPAELAGKAGKLGQRALFSKDNYQTDLQNTGIERTQTGHIEVIEMGVLSSELASKAAPPQRDCASIQTQYDDIAAQLTRPTGGLHGYGVIINPEQGTAVNYDAEALVQFSDQVLYQALNSGKPDLSSGNSTSAYIRTSTGPTTLEFNNTTDAISAALTKTTLFNDFVLEDSLNARSYWVITAPTKYLHTQQSLTTPFDTNWDKETTKACTSYYPKTDSGQYGYLNSLLDTVNRENGRNNIYACHSWATWGGLRYPDPGCVDYIETFCYGSNLMDLSASNRFSSANIDEASKFDFSFSAEEGKANGTLYYYLHSKPNHKIDTITNEAILGLPVIGFAVQIYVNGSLDGTVANYGVATKHKSVTEIKVN